MSCLWPTSQWMASDASVMHRCIASHPLWHQKSFVLGAFLSCWPVHLAKNLRPWAHVPMNLYHCDVVFVHCHALSWRPALLWHAAKSRPAPWAILNFNARRRGTIFLQHWLHRRILRTRMCQLRDFIPRFRDSLKHMGCFGDFYLLKSFSGFLWQRSSRFRN